MLINENDEGKEFCYNIRVYNLSLVFVFLGVNEDVLLLKGLYIFWIYGLVYYRIGYVFLEVGEQLEFL